MKKETWRPVPGYEKLYEVSSAGRIRNKHGKILKPHKATNGYYRIILYNNGALKSYAVHRLVATAFIPNTRGAECVNHIDECKTNNDVSNLEWVTPHENNCHGTARQRISETLRKYFKENPHHCRKSIRCVETNRVYSGVRVASRELGINAGSLSSCLNGTRKTAGGYHWVFVE